MKKRFLILFFILFQCIQVFTQYKGGNADGHDVDARLNTTLDNISLVILYQGSNGDGHDVESRLNTKLENIILTVLYEGQNGDGHDVEALLNTTLDNISLVVLYEGGNGDGHDVEGVFNSTLDILSLAVVYAGGNGDGHDVEGVFNTTLDNLSLAVIYEGGNGDGHDVESLLNTTLDNISLIVLYNGGNGDGFDVAQENVFLDPNQIVDLRLALKVLLQGATINPINSGIMNDVLRADGMQPTTSPYADMATVDPSIFNTGGTTGIGTSNNDIVDWVWIEIRNNTDNTFIVDDRSALLQRDGDVVDFDGVSSITLEGFTDSYYVAVKHRNHLGIVTLNAIPLSVATTNINLTNNTIPTFGTNAQVLLLNGSLAMWAGNVNGDTIIQYSGTNPDSPSILSEVLNNPGNFLNFPTYIVNSYNVNDIDMNGKTQYSGTEPDTPIILQNVLLHPGNFLNFPTYQILEQLPEN